MEDLLRLEANSVGTVPRLPSQARVISSPLRPGAWQLHLQGFLDPRFPEFILRGLCGGFRIGFNSSRVCQSIKQNMRSAYEHPDVVEKYLDREVQLQRLFPLTAEEALAESRMQISPFGVIRTGR